MCTLKTSFEKQKMVKIKSIAFEACYQTFEFMGEGLNSQLPNSRIVFYSNYFLSNFERCLQKTTEEIRESNQDITEIR